MAKNPFQVQRDKIRASKSPMSVKKKLLADVTRRQKAAGMKSARSTSLVGRIKRSKTDRDAGIPIRFRNNQ